MTVNVLDTLGDWKRTHTCGELRLEQEKDMVVLLGWVHRIRDHGGVLFIDLRDRYGITQVVARPEETPKPVLDRARELGTEWVVGVSGRVAHRPMDAVNREIATGEIEVALLDLRVFNTSETPPFPVNEEVEVSEDLRLTYRYLDLRRERMQRVLALRHQAALVVRNYLSDRGFLEIETPMLVKPTPEGARDYVVPSRLHPGRFYALPQSPQLYKQTLMAAGFDRYFQLARALRDEDLRADRQPEHTQIDIEISFVREDDVFELVEGLVQRVWREVLGTQVSTPFPRLSYREAMLRFGSDKPDLRVGLECVDVSEIAAGAGAEFLKRAATTEGHKVMALPAAGRAGISRKQLDELEATAKRAGAAGLSWMKRSKTAWEGGAAKFFEGEAGIRFAEKLRVQDGDLVLLTAGPWETACRSLGVVRLEMGRPSLGGRKAEWRFAWVHEFPLFERTEAGGWQPMHHIFTHPLGRDLVRLDTDPGAVHGELYDLVLNGVELGSGSVRIHQAELQEKVLQIIGIGHDEAREKFGFLLDAFRYGAPPHGGIALGFDRLVMMLAGTDNIRDVIAFPKTTSATSLMDGAPAPIDKQSLHDLHLKLDLKRA
jgi:aspartyl-tRNA synthetase